MGNRASLTERFKKLSKPLKPESTGTKPSLKKLNDIEAVIFDFYGTLFISGVGDIGIDDGKSDAGLLLDALKGSNISVTDPRAGERGYEIYHKVVTDEIQELKASGIIYPEPDIRHVWRNVLNQMYAEDLIGSATNSDQHDLLSVEFEARMNPIWPMPDFESTVEVLAQMGKTLGIISNSQFYTPIALEALAGKSLSGFGFDENLLHWSFEESMKKPGLTFYEGFLEKAATHYPNLKPHQFLYVGNDMLKDVYPAHHFGMKTALFAGDARSLKWHRDDSRTKNLTPDLIITELQQIPDCI